MPNEEYKKRLEEWMKTQKEGEREPEKPYEPGKMTVHAPLGCMIAGALFVLGVAYYIGALAGFWKQFLF